MQWMINSSIPNVYLVVRTTTIFTSLILYCPSLLLGQYFPILPYHSWTILNSLCRLVCALTSRPFTFAHKHRCKVHEALCTFHTKSGPRINTEQLYTVDQEIFVVKIFSDSMVSLKIKNAKIMCTINNNAVRGHLSENYLTRKFITWNICDVKYSRFTVAAKIHRTGYR